MNRAYVYIVSKMFAFEEACLINAKSNTGDSSFSIINCAVKWRSKGWYDISQT